MLNGMKDAIPSLLPPCVAQGHRTHRGTKNKQTRVPASFPTTVDRWNKHPVNFVGTNDLNGSSRKALFRLKLSALTVLTQSIYFKCTMSLTSQQSSLGEGKP